MSKCKSSKALRDQTKSIYSNKQYRESSEDDAPMSTIDRDEEVTNTTEDKGHYDTAILCDMTLLGGSEDFFLLNCSRL